MYENLSERGKVLYGQLEKSFGWSTFENPQENDKWWRRIELISGGSIFVLMVVAVAFFKLIEHFPAFGASLSHALDSGPAISGAFIIYPFAVVVAVLIICMRVRSVIKNRTIRIGFWRAFDERVSLPYADRKCLSYMESADKDVAATLSLWIAKYRTIGPHQYDVVKSFTALSEHELASKAFALNRQRTIHDCVLDLIMVTPFVLGALSGTAAAEFNIWAFVLFTASWVIIISDLPVLWAMNRYYQFKAMSALRTSAA